MSESWRKYASTNKASKEAKHKVIVAICCIRHLQGMQDNYEDTLFILKFYPFNMPSVDYLFRTVVK